VRRWILEKVDFGFVKRWILGELEMLELRNVCKSFGDVRVLDGVSLRLERGIETMPKLKAIRKRAFFCFYDCEKQFIAFENLLICSLKLVSIDEPFTDVDVENSEILYSYIIDSKKENVTFLIVEYKRQLLENIVNKEIELGEIKLNRNGD
jgi:ABC-type Mn2+/Zn2+ transport system ATPase subunit